MPAVEPSDLDRAPVLILEPIRPLRASGFIYYTVVFSLGTPTIGDRVRVTQLEYSFFGPDGALYGTVRDSYPYELVPGGSYGGGGPTFIETNLSRPLATRYKGRVSYTKTDGTTGVLEVSSTILEPR